MQLEKITAVIDPSANLHSQAPSGFAQSVPEGSPYTHTSLGTYKQVPSPCSSMVSVAVEVRSKFDPYLKAAELTQYKFEFGNTPGENVSTGITLLVLGIIFSAIPIGGCWLLSKQVGGGRRRRTGVGGPGSMGMVNLSQPGGAMMTTSSPLQMAPVQGGIYAQQQYQQPTAQYQQPTYPPMPVASAVAMPIQQPQQAMLATATAVTAAPIGGYVQPLDPAKQGASAPAFL